MTGRVLEIDEATYEADKFFDDFPTLRSSIAWKLIERGAWVKKHLCIAYHFGDCRGRIACCHARDIAPRGHGGGKPSDEWTFSACDKHHAESEKREQAWGEENGIDVRAICLEFAAKSPDKAIKDAAKAFHQPSAPKP